MAGAPRPPSRWGKVLLVSLLAGVLALAGAGFGGFMIVDNLGAETGPGQCGGGRQGCIPTLPAEAVIEVISDRGFACGGDTNQFDDTKQTMNCNITLGDYEYRLFLSVDHGHIEYYNADVFLREGTTLSPSGEAYLNWAGIIPFGADPAAEQAALEWLAEHLGGPEEEAEARIRGYRYQLEQSDLVVRLNVHGGV